MLKEPTPLPVTSPMLAERVKPLRIAFWLCGFERVTNTVPPRDRLIRRTKEEKNMRRKTEHKDKKRRNQRVGKAMNNY